jgi:phenylpyruvate tautomerase PptA (4-oxalocrotonate tautomerase family)
MLTSEPTDAILWGLTATTKSHFAQHSRTEPWRRITMPLVRIDVIEGRTPDQLRALADSVQQAMVEVFAAPERDRHQVIQEHASETGELG